MSEPTLYTLVRKKGQRDQLVLSTDGLGKGWKVVEKDVVLPRVPSERVEWPDGRRSWRVSRNEARAEARGRRARAMSREELVDRLEALEARLDAAGIPRVEG